MTDRDLQTARAYAITFNYMLENIFDLRPREPLIEALKEQEYFAQIRKDYEEHRQRDPSLPAAPSSSTDGVEPSTHNAGAAGLTFPLPAGACGPSRGGTTAQSAGPAAGD